MEMDEHMTNRLAAAILATSVAAAAVITAGPTLAATPAPDIAVQVGGNFPQGPNNSGIISVRWSSVGTADYSGVTHLTVDLPPSLFISGPALMSQDTPYDYTFTQTVSPDGHHLEAYFVGTRQPAPYYHYSDFMKLMLYADADAPSGAVTATVSNRDDVSTANNVATVTVGGEQSPPTVPSAPVIHDIDTTTGPGVGGTVVTLTGSNLDNGFVLFGNDNSTSASCASTSCTVTSPGGFGQVPVTVVTPGGSADAPGLFAYTRPAPTPPPAPVVTGLGYRSGPAAGGTYVDVLGSDLTSGVVRFGGVRATHVSCGESFCSAISPAGTGTTDVTVTTAGGRSATSSADQFTYTTS